MTELPPPQLKTHCCGFPDHDLNGNPFEPGYNEMFWCFVCDTEWIWNGAAWIDRNGQSWHTRKPSAPRGNPNSKS